MYWSLVVAKNAAKHLPMTLDSLITQTLRPERIVIVDDGSTDATPQILSQYKGEHKGTVQIISRPDRGYDIRRVPSNINLAWKTVKETGLEYDYFMISGDDCVYSRNYASVLISRMEFDRRLVVTSGSPSSNRGLARERTPSGSGRMINSKFWLEIGGMNPVKAGWEAWLLYQAAMRGKRTKLFSDLVYTHVQARGTKHQFVYWGAAMQTLGYNPLYALGRIAKNAITPTLDPRRAVNMLRGYLEAKLGSSDPFIAPFEPSVRAFVSHQQSQRIIRIASSLFI